MAMMASKQTGYQVSLICTGARQGRRPQDGIAFKPRVVTITIDFSWPKATYNYRM